MRDVYMNVFWRGEPPATDIKVKYRNSNLQDIPAFSPFNFPYTSKGYQKIYHPYKMRWHTGLNYSEWLSIWRQLNDD